MWRLFRAWFGPKPVQVSVVAPNWRLSGTVVQNLLGRRVKLQPLRFWCPVGRWPEANPERCPEIIDQDSFLTHKYWWHFLGLGRDSRILTRFVKEVLEDTFQPPALHSWYQALSRTGRRDGLDTKYGEPWNYA